MNYPLSKMKKAEKQKVFKLAKKGSFGCTNPKDLLMLVENIFDEQHVPLVIGNQNPSLETPWKVSLLKPEDDVADLTVRNFLQGLRGVSEIYNPLLFPDFGASLVFGMLDKSFFRFFYYSQNPARIVGLNFGSKGATKYGLNIYWKGKDKYEAESRIIPSRLDETMKAHIENLIEFEGEVYQL